jgi:hypothetical protein
MQILNLQLRRLNGNSDDTAKIQSTNLETVTQFCE